MANAAKQNRLGQTLGGQVVTRSAGRVRRKRLHVNLVDRERRTATRLRDDLRVVTARPVLASGAEVADPAAAATLRSLGYLGGGEDPRSWEVIRSRLVEDPFESQRMLNQLLPEH